MIEIEIRQSNIPYGVKGRLHVRVLPYGQIGYIRRWCFVSSQQNVEAAARTRHWWCGRKEGRKESDILGITWGGIETKTALQSAVQKMNIRMYLLRCNRCRTVIRVPHKMHWQQSAPLTGLNDRWEEPGTALSLTPQGIPRSYLCLELQREKI